MSHAGQRAAAIARVLKSTYKCAGRERREYHQSIRSHGTAICADGITEEAKAPLLAGLGVARGICSEGQRI